MRWVDKPYARPGRCALVPYRGQMTLGRWLDCGTIGPPGFEEHIYIHETSLREAAREFLGWQPPSALRGLGGQVAALTKERDDALAQVAAVQARLDAIDLIESAGYTARKKPGRKPQEVKA